MSPQRLAVCVSSSSSSSSSNNGSNRGILAVLPVVLAVIAAYLRQGNSGGTAIAFSEYLLLFDAGAVSSLLSTDHLASNFPDIIMPDTLLLAVTTPYYILPLLLLLVGLAVVVARATLSTTTTATRKKVFAVVTIYPALGVQLSTELQGVQQQPNNNNPPVILGTPLFLPHEEILDCLVYEVILSHKVVTVVSFRIRSNSYNGIDSDNHQSSLSSAEDDNQMRLIPAFPGTDMTYKECVLMRRQILNSLGR